MASSLVPRASRAHRHRNLMSDDEDEAKLGHATYIRKSVDTRILKYQKATSMPLEYLAQLGDRGTVLESRWRPDWRTNV